jgi:hypothetical protein
MTNNTCTFRNLKEMAEFCAELTRQGIAFRLIYSGDDYVVTICGY